MTARSIGRYSSHMNTDWTTKDIAEALAFFASMAPEGETEDKQTFQFGTLTIRCMGSREAIQAVADRYAKGFHRSSCYGQGGRSYYKPAPKKPAWQNMRRPPNADSLLIELEMELAE